MQNKINALQQNNTWILGDLLAWKTQIEVASGCIRLSTNLIG